MWIATDVIPSIRKHGEFIAESENVDEDFIKNELRFNQKRTIKTFAKKKESIVIYSDTALEKFIAYSRENYRGRKKKEVDE